MSRWFRMYADVLDDPKVQRLSDEDFRDEFRKAVAGEPSSAFNPYVVIENGRLPWPEWAIVRASVFERDNYTCRYCGVSGVKLECDHVVPLSKGGGNEKTNLATACQSCNRKKANLTLQELGWEA
jgi:5-methylcytosine-specific restriction endonuclease McrA